MQGRIIIPESFDMCFTYEQQVLYLAKWCGMLADAIGGPGSPAIDALNDAVDKINKTMAEIEISLTNFYNKGEIDVKFAGYYNKEESDNKYETKTDAQSAHDSLTAMINSRALKSDLDALQTAFEQAINGLSDNYATKQDLTNAINGLGDVYAKKSYVDSMLDRISQLEAIVGDINTQGEGIKTLLCIASPNASGSTPGTPGGYYYGAASNYYEDNGKGDISIINSGIYHGVLMCDVYPSQTGYGSSVSDPVGSGEPHVNNNNVGKYHLSDPNLTGDGGRYFNGYHVDVPQWAKDKYPAIFTQDSYDVPFYKAEQKLITAMSLIDYLIYALTCAGCTGRNKDHNLYVDSTVTAGSKKPVESGAVKAYVDAEIAKIRGGN